MLLSAFRYIISDANRIPVEVKLVVLVMFLRTLGWGFADPFFSIFINNFSENYTMVGLFVSLVGVVSFITIIPLMRLADKVQDTRLMENGEILYFFAIFSYTAAAYLKSVPLLLLALVLNGIGQPFIVVAAESFIRKRGEGNARSFGYYTAIDYFGWIIGMVIAAFTIQYYGLNNMFLFVLPSTIFGFLILFRIKEDGLASLIMGFRQYFHRRKDFQDLWNDFKVINPKMFFFLLLSFFDGVIRIFSYIFIPLLALTLNLDLKEISLLLAVMYLPFVFSFFFSEVADRMRKMYVIAFGLLIGASAFILLSFLVHQLWVIFLATMISLSMAIVRPAYNSVITRLTPRHMFGEVTGLNNLAMRFGYMVGPVFMGFVADRFGLPFSFTVMACIALLLGIATLFLRKYDFLPGTG
ncbi:MFS transporter [Candidatus Peregrinibacteria bacterium]|nr:MFS transporter [Candidatus Peregrinibacteria bacterium]